MSEVGAVRPGRLVAVRKTEESVFEVRFEKDSDLPYVLYWDSSVACRSLMVSHLYTVVNAFVAERREKIGLYLASEWVNEGGSQ